MADFQMLTSPRQNEPNMEDRDYNGLNTHLEVDFEDIVAEPETIHSAGCLWANSFKCFDLCLAVTYVFNTLFCGCCAVLLAAYEVGTTFFLHVWCCTPCLKAMDFHCLCPKTMCLRLVLSTIRPCCQRAVDHLTTYKRYQRPSSSTSAPAQTEIGPPPPPAAATAAAATAAEEGMVEMRKANGVSVDNKNNPV